MVEQLLFYHRQMIFGVSKYGILNYKGRFWKKTYLFHSCPSFSGQHSSEYSHGNPRVHIWYLRRCY